MASLADGNWSNEILAEAFQEKHMLLVNHLDPDHVTQQLFAARVLNADDIDELDRINGCRKKAIKLLQRLHKFKNPKSFIELRHALLSRENIDRYEWVLSQVEKSYNAISQRQEIGVDLSNDQLSQVSSRDTRTPGSRDTQDVSAENDSKIDRTNSRQLLAVGILTELDVEVVERIRSSNNDVPNLIMLMNESENPQRFLELLRNSLGGGNTEISQWLLNEVEKGYQKSNYEGCNAKPTDIETSQQLLDKVTLAIRSVGVVNDVGDEQQKKSPPVPAPRTPGKKTFPTVTKVGEMIDNPAVWGVTTLDKELYVYFSYASSVISAYDNITYDFQRFVPVMQMRGFTDMASCMTNQCIYIADLASRSIIKVSTNTTTTWSVPDEPDGGLSLNADCELLVTFMEASKIMVFTTRGDFVKDINLKQSDIVHPWHTVQLETDKYIVSHGKAGDLLQRVCVIDSSGCILQSFGGAPGSSENQLHVPIRLTVVKGGFIIVADFNNSRLVMLMLSPATNSTLCYVKSTHLTGMPWRMCYDEQTDRIHVGVNRMESAIFTSGNVETFTVIS